MEHTFDGFRLSLEETRADLVLDRPEKRNPLGTQTLLDIATAAHLVDEHGARVLVISGLGPSFCGGMHLETFATDTGADAAVGAAEAGRNMADSLESMAAIGIARIQGDCIGGGLVLAAACDLRVAATDARFAIPELDLGIPLAWGGLHRLVREMGPALTKELVMTCRPFDAAEALAAGFLNRMVERDELDASVDALADAVAARPRFTVGSTKATTNAITRAMVSLESAEADDAQLSSALADSECRAAAERYLRRFT